MSKVNTSQIKKAIALVIISTLAVLGVVANIDANQYLQSAVAVVTVAGLVNIMLEK